MESGSITRVSNPLENLIYAAYYDRIMKTTRRQR